MTYCISMEYKCYVRNALIHSDSGRGMAFNISSKVSRLVALIVVLGSLFNSGYSLW